MTSPPSVPHLPHYVFDELVHFVGAKLSDDTQRYELLKSILAEGQLRNPKIRTAVDGGALVTKLHGAAVMAGTADGRIGEVIVNERGSVRGDNMIIASVVCFCDIPDDHLSLHMSKYGQFGVGFPKSFLIPLDVRPVLYVPLSSVSIIGAKRAQWEAFDANIKDLLALITFQLKQELKRPGLKPGRPSTQMLLLTQMFEFLTRDIFGFVKVFDDRLPLDHLDNYYMEREWRSAASIRFRLQDISSIIVPDDYVSTFVRDFPTFKGRLKSVHGGTIRFHSQQTSTPPTSLERL